MGHNGALSVFAPAKINLTLHVVGRRADGYHLLDSLVAFAGVGDRVAVRPADRLVLEVTGPFARELTGADDNLVMRAARYLAAVRGSRDGAHITLEKNLPVAAGIGGGSADAAATLTALAQLWGVTLEGLSDAELAAKLGADVPVCLRRAPSFMRGIGEEITPAPALPPAWLVLVNPNKPLATKAVFAALGCRFSSPHEAAMFERLAGPAELARVLVGTRNDLAAPAATLMADVGSMLAALEGADGCLAARMSGSGPTCFGLFADVNAAEAAAKRLRAAWPGWWVAPAPLL